MTHATGDAAESKSEPVDAREARRRRHAASRSVLSPHDEYFSSRAPGSGLTPTPYADYDPLVHCLRSQFTDCCKHPADPDGDERIERRLNS